tara:strand:+ start:2935 stop:4734 length:1800 start_codon:yes stop_codon:yes gene_type:complete
MASGKKVAINYTSRDFDTIKRDLTNYAKTYYPNTYQDFSEAGFGSLMLDTVAYVGDILSFYVDYQANESYLSTASEYQNIIKLARQIGYKLNVSPSSYGVASFYVLIPSDTIGSAPNRAYLPVLKRGSQLSTTRGAGFVLNEDVDFGDASNKIVVAQVNESTGLPTHYAIQSYGQVVSGRYAETTFNVGAFQKFPKYQMPGTDVCEVISVEDTEGNVYYQVDNLTQNTIYRAITNTDTDDRELTPSLITPQVVSRRFIVEREGGRVFIQFGAGDESSDLGSAFTEPSSVVLFQNGKDYISDTAIDPTRLLESNKLGVAPSNTTLRVVYRVNTTSTVNTAANTLTQADKVEMSFDDITSLSTSMVQTVINSLQVSNAEPIVGDVTVPSPEEIRQRAPSVFASQNRAVTRQDYITLSYAMPERFGAVKRINVIQDDKSFKRNLNAYVISEDANGNLVQSNTSLKNNLKTWLNKNRMITDSIDILDAKIVNFSIRFEAVGKISQDNTDVLSEAVDALSTKFAKYFNISENLYISDIYSTLKEVEGILDVIGATVELKIGGNYSNTYFDFTQNTSADGRMIKIPQNVVLELKYPNIDIKGVLK